MITNTKLHCPWSYYIWRGFDDVVKMGIIPNSGISLFYNEYVGNNAFLAAVVKYSVLTRRTVVISKKNDERRIKLKRSMFAINRSLHDNRRRKKRQNDST